MLRNAAFRPNALGPGRESGAPMFRSQNAEDEAGRHQERRQRDSRPAGDSWHGRDGDGNLDLGGQATIVDDREPCGKRTGEWVHELTSPWLDS